MIDRDPSLPSNCFLKAVSLKWEKIPSYDDYPLNIPSIKTLKTLELNPGVTFFVGENGTGKSTLLEAMAVALNFNAEGGPKSFQFATHESHSDLWKYLRITKGIFAPNEGFFLRAETFYNVATMVDEYKAQDWFGGKSLHSQSHGESFFTLMMKRFGARGLYLLDEPEAALSPSRQLACLRRMHDLVKEGAQFVIATHAPILLAFPNATIYQFSADEPITEINYEETEHYMVTRSFLENPGRSLKELLRDDDGN